MSKRPLTPGYIFFYILFSADTWRILTGVVLALLLAPSLVASRELSQAGEWVLWLMVAGVGYGFSGRPAKKFAAFLRRKVTELAQK